MGDFNLRFNQATEDSKWFLNKMGDLRFSPMIDFYTHQDGNTIDQVFF